MQPAIFRPFSGSGDGAIKRKKSSLGLGDRVERIVKPIAVALKLKCLDEEKQLKPASPCAKRREALNKAGEFIGIGKTV